MIVFGYHKEDVIERVNKHVVCGRIDFDGMMHVRIRWLAAIACVLGDEWSDISFANRSVFYV